jgi:hypothetical protein
MNITRFTFYILLAAFVCVVGCATRTSDPLAGWKCTGFGSPNKAIADDYQDYIQQQDMRGYAGPIQHFEDGTGQQAIEFEVFEHHKNASWRYVLIYDKENKRIQVIKYGYARYDS